MKNEDRAEESGHCPQYQVCLENSKHGFYKSCKMKRKTEPDFCSIAPGTLDDLDHPYETPGFSKKIRT